jgi:hypothetical protein
MVDALSGLEVLVIGAEVLVVIGGFLFQLFGAMLGAENRMWIGDGEAASAATGRTMGATNRYNNGISRLWFHFGPLLRVRVRAAVVFFDAECGND